MRPALFLLMCGGLALLACQGQGNTQAAVRAPQPIRAAAVSPPVPAASRRLASPPPASPRTEPSPLMVVDRPAVSTPLPSGYVVTLPSGVVMPTFAPLPSAVPGASSRPTGGVTPPTLAPSTPPAAVAAVRVVANTLPFGEGELAGAVFEPGEAQPLPVPAVRIILVAVADATRRAELVGASDGTFRLREVALGEYFVRVEKDGYAADSAPTLMRLYPGYTSGYTLFYIVPDR